mmetsp:Transcript_17188/g.25593  ORF Transcript_17188/g.25593 Transcript_17188/m.25593 type:complete len:513 (+) Transcript_17188:216-1754(+)
MATNPTLLRAVTVISILIIHPLLITSHTLLRKRSDDIHNDQNFSAEEHHDYISTKILTKLIPSTNITSSSSSSSASPMACIHQENKLKKCYEKLPQSFNEIKCTQCIYGNVNPSTQVITCPHSDYCSSVSGCTKGVCPKECKEEFYEVLNCIWKKAGCASTAGVGDGDCGVANKMKKGKKKVASDPYPSRGGTTATVAATATSTSTKAAAAVSSKNGSNPCSECSTSEGGARHNFCGNLNVNPIQDACSSQTECSDRGLKCKVCTKIVNNDGYGGKSVVEDVGSGAYVCVKDEEEGGKKAAPAAAGKGGGNDTTSAATSAASSSTTSSNTKKQKGADTAAVTTSTSSTGKKKQKGVTTTTSSTTPAGGFCHSRAVVLGNCIFTKDTSPDCLNCIHSGTQEDSSDDPTCKQVQQHQFCTNIASCAKEHCGKCTFEFYTGLNCVLQKIHGCEQFSCAIGGGGIEGAISSSSGSVGGGYDASSDGYSLQQFRDDVERQCKMMNPRMEDEVFVREA